MDPNNAIKLSILAGEIMLSSGAETHRVEDTMLRILECCGLVNAESLCTSTSIFASGAPVGGTSITMLKRVKNRGNNFEKIAHVNELSRSLAEGKIGIEAAISALEDIQARPPYSKIVRLLGAAVASSCFAMMLGGSLPDSANAFIAAFLMQIPLLLLERHNVAGVLRNMIGGGCAALIALVLINLGLGSTIDFIIIGSIMPLLPGVSLTNAIRDILDGDLLSGSARILDAFLVAIAIATGVGTVMMLWMSVFGGVVV
ncbi:MAG: threonine/serine exporter family protein [Defluviitaleaceae bacterium]|nr:threonine/serine exporter family protein [Defluviitaleaceae bacterium]